MTMSEDEGGKGLNWRRGFLRAPDRGGVDPLSSRRSQVRRVCACLGVRCVGLMGQTITVRCTSGMHLASRTFTHQLSAHLETRFALTNRVRTSLTPVGS